ncbi:MAG TPA: ABC transporter permease [Bacteroidia bacterium]|nr:ABC transporter permease [Bacteroidia bacterium]
MSLAPFIARRYFFSKKSQRAINIISMISVLGVTIGTAALIIVLSVFNGFEDLILRLYNSFDPDIKISKVEGKSFHLNSFPLQQLREIDGVQYVSEVLEENALVKYRDKQTIVSIKGVNDEFEQMTGIDSMIAEGEFKLKHGDLDFAIVGAGIAYKLQLNIGDLKSQLEIYAPKKNSASLLNAEEAFNRRFVSPSGVFSIQQEFDTKYIIVPLRLAYEILEKESQVSALEIGLNPGVNTEEVQKRITELAGNSYQVKNRYQQHELIYKIMKSEKWAVFLILTFILIIATFNVISSLTMLVIEKKKDITILHSLGANSALLRKIFLLEGIFITALGAIIGLTLGFTVCFLQERFGLIQLGGSGSFVIDAYPVKMQVPDFFYVLATVFFIGFIAAWYPSKKLIGDVVSVKTVKVDE